MIIYKNEDQIKRRIQKAERVLPVTQKLNKLLQMEDIHPTIEHLKGFYSSGVDYVKNVLLEQARPSVEKLDIPDKLKRTMLNDAMNIDEDSYLQVFSEMHQVYGPSGIEPGDLELNKGTVVLSKEFKTSVENSFTVDIDTVEKQEFWQNLKYLADAFNRLEELAEKMGEPSLKEHIDPNYFTWLSFEENGKYCRISPDANGFIKTNFMV